MTDISLYGKIMLSSGQKPQFVYKCSEYMVFQFDDYILITKLSGDTLTYRHKLRIAQRAEILVPPANATKIFIVINDYALYQYDLLTGRYVFRL